jgi:feruloyl esterase
VARVFVTGLSAGGAMTSALLATYPDIFAAGAVIAGLPYRCASNVGEAFAAMQHCPSQPPSAWGRLVRDASPAPQRKPIVSIWHGEADTTVALASATEQAKQWCDVHGLRDQDGVDDIVDGAKHRVWRDAGRIIRVELYVIAGLGHGVPIDPTAAGDRGVGEAMPYVLKSEISSTWRIAKSWGLVG